MRRHHKRLLLRRAAVCLVIGAVVALGTLPAVAQWEPNNQVFSSISSPVRNEFVMVFPQDVKATDFYSSFGARRSGGRRHEGNDLMAPKMTPVYAAADGMVIEMGRSRRSGYYLIIDHGGGWTTWYVHLNNDTPGTDDGKALHYLTFGPGIAEGVAVQAGQVIGYVGDSGNAEGTAPHTHFELHRNGRPINPYPYLATAYERGRLVASIEGALSLSEMLGPQLRPVSSPATRRAILSLLLPSTTMRASGKW